MPTRRGVKGAFAGLGEGLEQIGGTMMQEGVRDRQAKRQLLNQLVKDYSDRVEKGEMDPGQAEAALKMQGATVPAGYFDSVQPSVSSRLSRTLQGIEGAESLSKVPGPTSIATELKAKRVPLMNPGIINPETGESSGRLSPELDTALQTRIDKLASFPATRVSGIYDPSTGATREDFIPARESTQARSFQTSPTPEQKGFNEAAEQSTKLTRQSELGIPEEEARQFSRKAAGERGAKAADTFATIEASHRASLPFQKEMAAFTNNLPELKDFTNLDTGETQFGTVRRGSGEVRMIGGGPGGFDPGKGRQIPATIADNLAGINTAEIEGVKILRTLRKMGLQDVNDIADPRWNQFVVNVLHASPEDWNKADMQQRIGFVNANLTRALMGSRPSQYVAQTIIQPHLPKQDMTGKQLEHTLINVLQQAQERRAEFAHTLFGQDEKGQPRGLKRLSPSAGSYEEYQRELGIDTTQPANFTIDANGRLVPLRRQ